MPRLVLAGAKLRCDRGSGTSCLVVDRGGASSSDGHLLATVMDFVGVRSIPSFGTCLSLTNPTVASASAAAQGVLTPMPCVPLVVAPWTPGSAIITVDGMRALTDGSECACQWAGRIKVYQTPGAPQNG